MLSKKDEDETNLDIRVSYLVLQEEKQKTLNKKYLLNRIICISKISEYLQSKESIGSYFSDLFDGLQRKHQCEATSGILLIYPDYIVHAFESSMELIIDALHNLHSATPSSDDGSSIFPETKIVHISHDIPTRLFQQWSYQILNLSRPIGTFQLKQPVQTFIFEVISSILKIGAFLMRSPKSNNPERFQEMTGDLLIHSDHLVLLMMSDSLLTPGQYLKMFDRPLDIVLDSELMWPIDQNISNIVE